MMKNSFYRKWTFKTMFFWLITFVSFNPSLQAQTLLWSDEFNGSSLDQSIWTYAIGDGCAEGICGWGNQELQTYTDQNTSIVNGNLVITARRENVNAKEFTSARLLTKDKLSIKYGRVEASIQLPNMNNGLWPAFWMLGDGNRWPYTGEIDIMEAGFDAIATDVNVVAKANVFWRAEDAGVTGNLQFGNEDSFKYDALIEAGKTLNQDFFVYRVDWTPTGMATYVLETDASGEPIESTAKEIFNISNSNTFESEFFSGDNFYLLLNMAVGGWLPFDVNNGENTAANVTALPNANSEADMLIDYVRVYEIGGFGEVTLGEVDSELLSDGGFGIFSDNTTTDHQLVFGTDSEVFVWEDPVAPEVSLQTIAGLYGAEAYQVTLPANQWAGFTLNSSDVLNLSEYTQGSLRFKMKTTSQEPFRISMSSVSGEAGVNFISGGEQYGLVRDGLWHDVEIPLGLLITNFKEVTVPFTIGNVPSNNPTVESIYEIDEIHLSASAASSVSIIKPSLGDFGVYTESTVASEFVLGTDGDLFVWEETLLTGPVDTYNGQDAISYVHNNKGWFGFAFTANQLYDLSAYENGFLNIAMKSSSSETLEMRINVGLAGGQITFEPGSDPYGFARDGQWHELQIPISDFEGLNADGVLHLLSISGGGNISDIAVSDIYYSCGGPCVDNANPPGTNLALAGTVDQSSIAHGGAANRAIDGNNDGNWGSGSITHTATGIGEWWLVDLGANYEVEEIVIWNRIDCCSDRLDDITVSIESPNGAVYWEENVMSSSASSLTINVAEVSGQIVRITQNQNAALSLAEVEVYGAPSPWNVVSDVNFEDGWDIWIDGGDDARRDAADAVYSNGTYSVRLRDNTSTSVMTTSVLDLSSYDDLKVNFSYYPRSMDNASEDFWLQLSTDGGATFTTVASWALNSEFVNDQFYIDEVVLNGASLSSATVLRFRCDASGNADYVYIDDIVISVAGTGGGSTPIGDNTITIQESTSGFCLVDGTIDSNQAGFTGSGFANTSNANGNGIEWAVSGSAGTYTLTWRYAVINNRPASLIIDGIAVGNTPFNATGSWIDWDTQTMTVNLGAGVHDIRLEATQVDGLGNIDYLQVTGPGVSSASCTSSARQASDTAVGNSEGAEFSKEPALIYPVPTSELLNIALGDRAKYNKLEVIDFTGRVIIQTSDLKERMVLDVNNLSKGIYLLRLQQIDGSVETLKFVK